MYKEFVISAIIIVLVVALDITTGNYTKETLHDISDSLNIVKEESTKLEKDDEKLNENVNNAFGEYNSRHDILACYLEHNELEKVETYLTQIKSNIETKEYETLTEKIDTCIFILKHIEEKEKLALKNIF